MLDYYLKEENRLIYTGVENFFRTIIMKTSNIGWKWTSREIVYMWIYCTDYLGKEQKKTVDSGCFWRVTGFEDGVGV